MHEPQDAAPFVPWLPFGRCAHCDGVVVTEGGFVGPHLTPCGAHCTLAPTPDHGRTCSGWCSACRTARTGCAGDPDRPCGRPGCPECGVHYVFEDHGPSWPGRLHGRPSCRVAWTWDRVTCGECLRLRTR